MEKRRRKVLRPRQRPERAVKVQKYNPAWAIELLKTRLVFLGLGFDYYRDVLTDEQT